jgi:hypothetical protein
VNNATVDLQLLRARSTNTPTTGISLVNVADGGGTNAVFSSQAGGASLTTTAGATGPIFNVSGGNAKITYPGTITNNSTTARAVSITSWAGDDAVPGDDLLLSGAIDENGAGILVNGNGGSRSITFSGGLDIDTTSGEGFAATSNTNTGGLHVTGTNDITSTSATALRVTNTTIGNSNLNFRNVSSGNATAAADPVNGIVLNTTGTAGKLIITGTGGAGTGGVIQRTTGDGILLTSTNDVTMSWMNVTSNLGAGVRGTTLNGFVFNNNSVSSNGDQASPDESGLELSDLTGDGSHPTSISNNTISNNYEFQVQITNSSGTLTDLQFNGNTVSSTGASGTIGNLVNVLGLGSASATLNLLGGTYTGAAPATATGVHCDHSGSSGLFTCNISGATFTNNNVAVNVSQAQGGSLDFTVSGNTATGNRSHGLNLFVAATGTGAVEGSFLNNLVGTLGVSGSGSNLGFGIRIQNEGSSAGAPAVTVLVDGNTVQEMASFAGINVNQGIAGQASTRTTNVTITDNVVREVDNSRAIIVQQNNTTAPGLACADLSGNDMSNVAGNIGDGTKIRFRQLTGGTFNVRQRVASGVADPLELDDANSVGGNITTAAQISTSGAFNYNAGVCPLP